MLSKRVREMISSGDAYPLASSYKVDREMVKMCSNENPFGASPKAVEAVKSEAENINKYPKSTSGDLKEAIADSLGVNPLQICVGNGSDELMDLSCKAFLDPGDTVLIPVPTFSQYALAAKANAMKTKSVQMKDFRLNANELVEAMSDCEMIFLARPNNPTGRSLSEEGLRKLLDTGKMIVVDEAYGDFSGDSVVDFISDYGNLLVLKTFSKAYGLAGLRVGYGMAGKDLVEGLERVRPPFSVNRIAQKAALAALKDEEFLEKTLNTVREGRKYLTNRLEELGFKVIPSEANFLMVSPAPLGSDANELCKYLEDRGIMIRNLSGFEGVGARWVRITVGKESENKRLIEVLTKRYGGEEK